MLFKHSIYLAFALLFTITAQAQFAANAQFDASAQFYAQGGTGLQGSGYWGGTQVCPYRTRTSKAAVNISDEEKEERKQIARLNAEVRLKKAERDRAESKLKAAQRKIERFFESDIAEFLISTHMDKSNKCEDYRTFPEHQCPIKGSITAATSDATSKPDDKAIIKKCQGLEEVPSALKESWISADGTGYCTANSDRDKGRIDPKICNDKTLRPIDAPKNKSYNTKDCSTALVDYRKARLEYDNAQAKVDRQEEEINDRTTAVADARERAKIEREYKMKSQLEGECEECNKYGRDGGYEKPERDWWSTAANVVGGLGLYAYGKKIDESAQEYNAQLGSPSTNSYGYPYVTAGIYSVINGLAGPGAYGCGGGIGGAGFPFGAGGAWGGLGANGYGPYAANGGAFSYPSWMYGSPWGGGMYAPGFGANGTLAGPNGGWPFGFNGQVGIGAPLNGQIGSPAYSGWQGGNIGGAGALCFTWPCNVGGQIGIPASGGWPQSLPTIGGWQQGGLNSQYQLQMLQQQQLALQQQAQQQAQLAQYYQAQAQAQMQDYQRRVAIQQQAQQVQQEIQSLQLRLQMLVSGAYSGSSTGIYGGTGFGGTGLYGGGILGGGFGIGGVGSVYFGAASSTGSLPTLPVNYGTSATLPGLGTGGRGR